LSTNNCTNRKQQHCAGAIGHEQYHHFIIQLVTFTLRMLTASGSAATTSPEHLSYSIISIQESPPKPIPHDVDFIQYDNAGSR